MAHQVENRCALAIADVVDLSHGGRGLGSLAKGFYHVVHVDEIAGLQTIAVDGRGAALAQEGDEQGDDAEVGVFGTRARAEKVENSQPTLSKPFPVGEAAE